MKRILFGLLLVILAAVLVVLALATTQPDTFEVRRTATIDAPAEVVFPLVNDFHQWDSWSPWEKLDPNMKKTHGGAASGLGAIYAWEGNSDAGAGQMEIIESEAPSKVTIQLDFTAPFESTSTTEFMLEPDGDATMVTWSMYGPMQFLTKVMCVFVSMDAMIGKDFEEGLASLKAAAEGP
jgi:uncharacterized protein YndB with AHSA1/START domain